MRPLLKILASVIMSKTFAIQYLPYAKRYRRLTCFPVCSVRVFSSGRQVSSSKNSITKVIEDKLTSTTKQFDNFLGIAEVRAAQSLVEAAEETFMKSRRSVQETRTELLRIQTNLRELRSKLDRIPREDERYLQLATQEHKVLVEERKLKTNLEDFVALERDNFAAFSTAVRNAHEKERSRAERTKYWSIIGSACGAVVGIFGSTIINMKRMRQIKLTVQEHNQAFMDKTMEELKRMFYFKQLGLTSPDTSDTASSAPTRKTSADSSQSTPSHVKSIESNKLLMEIDAKLDEFHQIDLKSLKGLTSAIQELKQEFSGKNSLEARNLVGSETPIVVDLERQVDRHLQNTSWWSKLSVAVSVATFSCSVLLYLSR